MATLKEKIKGYALKAVAPFKLMMEKIHITITVLALLCSVLLIIPQLYRLVDNVGPEQWPIIPGIIGAITFILGAYIMKKATQ
jgi:hypothetical protein